jgi:bile acid:Na+ symporter, BASS family
MEGISPSLAFQHWSRPVPHFLMSHALEIVQGLAFSSLFGLLLAIGLQTSFKALMEALRRVRLGALVLGNFFLIPVLATTLILYGGLSGNASRALIFLACAPFAPVVPLFVRMARGDLALATGLTALFPAFSALLTPCATALSFWLLQDQGNEPPSVLLILELLAASITLPLLLGIGFREFFPTRAKAIQKPMEGLSEAVGVLSLGYLASIESGHLAHFTLSGAWPYILFYEVTFMIGLALGEGAVHRRLVMAFGSANRNIGLAILLAATLVDDPEVLGEVFAQSLLLIALGLIHVAVARAILSSTQFRRWVGSDKPSR